VELPEADPPRQPARRGGDRGLARRALAGPKKGAAREGRTIVWVDESGFYLLPGLVRTYAPRGRTPVVRVPLTNDHLSAISAVTPDGRLLLLVQDRAIRSPDVVRFLQHLLRHLPGKLLVLWDGAPIHRGQPVKDFLAAGGAKRVRLEQLPGYAPELNGDEGVWNQLKRVELRNVCCRDLPHLRRHLRSATARLRHKRRVLQGYARHALSHV
jgi:transposase